MSNLYFNGSLIISAFSLQHNKDGSWIPARVLSKDHKYRFLIRVENNAKDPFLLDVGMRILDIINPVFLVLPQSNPAFVYGNVKVTVTGPPSYLTAYRFYHDSSFTGPYMPGGTAKSSHPLRRGDHEVLHLHFKWAGPPANFSSSFPSQYAPRVTLNAREVKVLELPDGPIATLQPSV